LIVSEWDKLKVFGIVKENDVVNYGLVFRILAVAVKDEYLRNVILRFVAENLLVEAVRGWNDLEKCGRCAFRYVCLFCRYAAKDLNLCPGFLSLGSGYGYFK